MNLFENLDTFLRVQVVGDETEVEKRRLVHDMGGLWCKIILTYARQIKIAVMNRNVLWSIPSRVTWPFLNILARVSSEVQNCRSKYWRFAVTPCNQTSYWFRDVINCALQILNNKLQIRSLLRDIEHLRSISTTHIDNQRAFRKGAPIKSFKCGLLRTHFSPSRHSHLKAREITGMLR